MKLRARINELKKAVDVDQVTIYEGIWGEMSVEYYVYKERFDVTPFLKGLPNDLDPSPHWGIIMKGEITIKYDGKEEKAKAGDVYYAPPGHTVIAEAGTEFWEFSPKDLLQKTNEVVTRNMQAMMPKQQ